MARALLLSCFQPEEQVAMWVVVLQAEVLLHEFVALRPSLRMSEEGIVRRCV